MDGRHTTAAGYHRLVSGRPNMASVAFIGDAVEDDERKTDICYTCDSTLSLYQSDKEKIIPG